MKIALMNSTVRPLANSTETDLDTTFQRMAEFLTAPEEDIQDARVQFRILEGAQELCWHLDLTPKGCQVRAEKISRPDFEIITKAETWKQIALGSLSPLSAFTQDKMRVRGNIELGQRLLRRLASESLSDEVGK